MTAAHDPEAVARRNYCLALLTAGYTLNFLDRSVVNVLLDAIKSELHLSDTALGFVAGLGFALLYTLLGIPFARLADRTSRKGVIAFGMLLWSLMTAMGGLAQSGLQLVLARTGVGIGEAAGTASSHAMLSEYFTKDERPRALGVLNLGLPAGVFLGIFLGGWTNQLFGWRVALFFAGVPGLIVAALLYFTVAEPGRLAPDGPLESPSRASFWTTVRFLCSQPSYLFSLSGSFFSGFGLNAIFVWSPVFFGRVHHMASGEVGALVGSILGISGILGVITGGAVVSRFSRGDDRWKPGQPALACLLAAPFVILMLLVDSKALALTCLGLGSFLAYSLLGPIFSIYQCVARPRMRATATAIHNLVGALGGLGLGAVLVGMASDRLTPHFGHDAIRYALILPMVAFLPGGLLYALGCRTIRRDVLRAAAEG